jgi:hypothetical protein
MGKPNRKKRRGKDYCVMGIFIRGFFSLQLFHAPKSFRGRTPISTNSRRFVSDIQWTYEKAAKGRGTRKSSLYGSSLLAFPHSLKVFLFRAIVDGVSSAVSHPGFRGTKPRRE